MTNLCMDTLVDVEAIGGSRGTGAVDRTHLDATAVLGTEACRTAAAGKDAGHQ